MKAQNSRGLKIPVSAVRFRPRALQKACKMAPDGPPGSATQSTESQESPDSRLTAPESREERASGLLWTGEVSPKRFGESIGVAHGTIKRWMHEGLPARRNGNRAWLTPAAAEAWVAVRYPNTIARGRRGTVYVVARATDGAIKIGWTGDVMRRVAELRKESRTAVELIACFPGDKPDELRLHDRFLSDRLDGEWHSPSPAILSFIDNLRGHLT